MIQHHREICRYLFGSPAVLTPAEISIDALLDRRLGEPQRSSIFVVREKPQPLYRE
jgi:hypothetical protein